MRKVFDAELKELEMTQIKLFNCADSAISGLKDVFEGVSSGAQGVEALTAAVKRQKSVYGEAGTLASALETQCVRLLISQQPVARDLREIKSAMKVVYDLLRIAEMCAHTAEICMGEAEYTGAATAIESAGATQKTERMRASAESMVKLSAEAYFNRNRALAQQVVDADDSVDADFGLMRKELVRILKTREGRDDFVLDYLLIAKYLERIADHAVKIAEETFFLCG